MVRLIHLSDIHFRRGLSGGIHDLDKDLRNELVRDVSSLRDQLGDFSAVLVTGDIAFSGKTEEYAIADEWLKELCAVAGVKEHSVWTTPGNHDVDRDAVDRDDLIALVHQRLRDCPAADVDEEIRRYFEKGPNSRELLFQPLKAYNDFAFKFGCAITAANPTWQHRLLLNDGSALILRGLNSTLISDSRDNDLTHKLVLGQFQSVCPSGDGVVYITLCHHPPDWLRDGEGAETNLTARVAVQLFGHKHKHKFRKIDNSIQLAAGAMHPNRDEKPWQPRYNVLSIEVESTSPPKRELVVTLYPRVWNEATRKFSSDLGGESHLYHVDLPPWSPSAAVQPLPEPPRSESEPAAPETAVERENRVMDRARRLAYRFLTLPYHKRIEIAQALDLIDDEDRGVSEDVLFSRFFQRARDTNKLADLWARVEGQYGEGGDTVNPFKPEETTRAQ